MLNGVNNSNIIMKYTWNIR